MKYIKYNQSSRMPRALSIVPARREETHAAPTSTQTVESALPRGAWKREGLCNFHGNSMGRVLLAISLMVLGGCAEWSSNPARTQADYGISVRNMVSNQVYNPDKAQHPEALLPDGMEGNKANIILEGRAYRRDIGNPADVRHSLLGNPGLSGRGGSGGSAR